ncbi:MAG: RHS repeat-associated core domain-containing protein [Bacteroidota bacterium]
MNKKEKQWSLATSERLGGAMIFLSVDKRDTIDLTVNANYERAPSNNNFLGTAQAQNFYPFGLQFGEYQRTASTPQRFKFQGKERVAELGLDDFGARFYMPDLGRWMSPDPLAHEYMSFSLYNFVLNNPINAIDPDGK